MSSFFFEQQEVNCNCFENSPKDTPKIFRSDPNYLTGGQNKEIKQFSLRNTSEQGKSKKKSLKKQRPLSSAGSQTNPKQKQQSHPNNPIPNLQIPFTPSLPKKEQRINASDHFEQPWIGQIKSERNKTPNMIRYHKPQALYQPVNFQQNQPISVKISVKKAIQAAHEQKIESCGRSQTFSQPVHQPILRPLVQIHSQKKIIDYAELDKHITRQFEKDFRQFKLHMDMIEGQPSQRSMKSKHKEFLSSVNKTIDTHPYRQIQSRNRYPITEHIISIPEKQKTSQRAISLRNSVVSDRQKHSTKKTKNRMFPKQIESQKGSNSGSSSGRESVFLGRGLDGLTQKRESIEEIEISQRKEQKTKLQTLVTQESNIKNSQINTMTQYSNILTSPKSQQNIGMAFGGGKYGVARISYQEIAEIRGPKLSSLRKIYF